MRVNWEQLREERMRQAAREEAAKVTADALERFEAKITAMWMAENDRVRAGMMYGLLGALRETVQEITGQKPSEPVSRPAAVDPHPGYRDCGDTACMRSHSASGGHL